MAQNEGGHEDRDGGPARDRGPERGGDPRLGGPDLSKGGGRGRGSTDGTAEPGGPGPGGAAGSAAGAGPGGELVAGRYLLGDVLGSGGMGKVWQAEDTLLGRQVAVKELRVAQPLAASDLATLHNRMKQEARAAARVNHPGVVTVHDVLEHDGRPWIVMELVDGRSLADVIDEEGTLLPRDAASVGGKVLLALRAAHDAGVLHRDVKPGNVLLSRDGRVLLTDFGIATLEGGTALTRTGDLVGSPDFLAPERAMGRRPGPESDLWSLGATLYAAVEGQSPFRRTSALSTLQAVVTEEPPEPRYAGALAPVLTALLRKDPHERPGHAEAARMLADVAEGRSVAAGDAGTGPGYAPTQLSNQTPQAPYPGGHPGQAPAQAQSRAPGMPPGVPTATNLDPATPPVPFPLGPAPPGSYPPYTPPVPYPHLPQQGANGGGNSGRRPWVLVAAVALVAALAGGGVALAALDDKGGGASAGSSPSPSASDGRRPGGDSSKQPQGRSDSPKSPGTGTDSGTGSGTGSGSGGSPEEQPGDDVPPGYTRVNDPAGFSMAVPEGWTREVNEGQIDYTPDGGRHLLRVGVLSGATASAYDHFVELEVTVAKFQDYRRVQFAENTFRGRTGALWEFTWTATKANPGPRRGVDQGYIEDDGTEYDLYASSPEADWTATQRHFQTMLRTWKVSR